MADRRLQINPEPLRVVDRSARDVWAPAAYKTMRPQGERTTDDWRVGETFKLFASNPPVLGVCVSVTPWGNDRIRWVRLRFPDGTERSYAPSHLIHQPEGEPS